MAIHNFGEALQVVIAEEALQKRFALPVNRSPIPRTSHRQAEQAAWTRPQALTDHANLALQQGEKPPGEAKQNDSHRSFGEGGQSQGQPAQPPGNAGIHQAPPGTDHRQGHQGCQQAVAHPDPTPQHHQGAQPETERRRKPQTLRAREITTLPPGQQQSQQRHHSSGGEGGRKCSSPGTIGIPAGLARKAVDHSHQPIHKRRLVVTG